MDEPLLAAGIRSVRKRLTTVRGNPEEIIWFPERSTPAAGLFVLGGGF